jgi:hypothetical protein
LQRDIYGMISDAKTLFLGVVSFANFAPKGRLTRKLTYTVKRAAPMQAFMGAVPIVVGDPLRELFADVGRFGVGSVPELLQYRSLHTLHFAIQLWGARRYWPKPDGFVHQSALNFLGEELSAPVGLNALDRERHLVENLVQESEGRFGVSVPRYAGDKEPAAIIDGGELV